MKHFLTFVHVIAASVGRGGRIYSISSRLVRATRVNPNLQSSEAYGAALRFESIVHVIDKMAQHSRFDHSR